MKRNVLIPESVRKYYDRTIRQVIVDLSICISIYNPPTSVNCTNCMWDPVHKKSSGIFTNISGAQTVTFPNGSTYSFTARSFNRICPICKGEGVLSTSNRTDISALVTWNRGNHEFFPAGLERVLMCRLKTDACNYEIIRDADYFEVDSVNMVLFRPPDFHGMGDQNNICVAFLIDANDEMNVPKTVIAS